MDEICKKERVSNKDHKRGAKKKHSQRYPELNTGLSDGLNKGKQMKSKK